MASPCPVCFGLDHKLAKRPKLDEGSAMLKRRPAEFTSNPCKICHAHFLALQFFENALGVTSQNRQVTLVIYRDGHSELQVSGPSGADVIQLYVPPGEYPAWDGIYIAPEISPSPSSPMALRFIGECLVTCTTGHNLCQQDNTVLPTRLLFLGNSDPNLIQLVEPKSGSCGQYAALSYCWGKGASLTATKHTLPSLKSGFALAMLPQTIQDAITVSRKLGIKHIWVDALCIIQDSTEDWEKESARMASVYQNAFVTIAATSASASDQGFLGSFSPHMTEAVFSLGIQRDQDIGVVNARIRPNHDRRNIIWPLDTRGWTLQESLLSTRVISFTPNEIRWTCNMRETCECLIRQDTWFQGNQNAAVDVKSPQQASRYWWDTVRKYSTRNLTVKQDKLPAMSGVAKIVQQVTGSAYVAGLWADTLVTDLAWVRNRLQDRETYWAPADYIAPTFSWASVEGHISSYPHVLGGQFEAECEVGSVDIPVPGANPFGQVTGGQITLRGHLFETKLTDASGKDGNDHFWWGGCQYAVDIGGKSAPFEPDARLAMADSFDNSGRQDGEIVCRAPEVSIQRPVSSPSPVWGFHLCRSSRHRLVLVLGRSRQGGGLFERLGILVVVLEAEASAIQSGPSSVVTIG